MRILFVAIFSCLLCICLSCSTGRSHKPPVRLAGTWQATPITPDGKNTDWPSPYPFINDKAGITYAISNDKDNLYITVVAGDPATAMKILRKGLLVWIDKTGRKNQVTSVCFPSDNEGAARPAAAGRAAAGRQMDEALATATEFFLQGFKGCRGRFTTTQPDSCGIRVGIGLDEYDQLVWEAVIPFRAFYTKAEIDKRDEGRPLDICFDIQGLPRPAGQRGGGGLHAGPSIGVGGMGFGMRSGMGGGRRPGPGDGDEQLYKSTSFWKKVGIAYQQ